MPQALELTALDTLFAALRSRGYRIIGPTVRNQAIVYDELHTPAELPAGWTDEQEGGRYRLRRRDDDARFGYNIGPTSWKRWLHPPAVGLWHLDTTGPGSSFQARAEPRESRPLAFVGVRACELRAIEIQDRVLLHGPFVDPIYLGHRRDVLLVAVNCTQAGGTCFCLSTGTGPVVESGHDLVLTELLADGRHVFVADAGSDRGREILDQLDGREARPDELSAAEQAVSRASSEMGRHLETGDLEALLLGNQDHPRWEQVAERCLACGNCTMVCPTCFCTTVEDVSNLSGRHFERRRRWDSCFSTDFSYLHGGSVRASVRSRYRQWLTHKLASWIGQFGTSGCVGCGRCITWCPVGIDLTEEVRALRTGPTATKPESTEESAQ